MTNATNLSEQGKQAYQKGNYLAAAILFQQAAQACGDDALTAAEMMNNRSVALLMGGKAEESLEATEGTEQVFAQTGDLKRQGMVIGNRAAALEGLKKWDEALAEYNRAASIFEQGGEGDLHSMMRKAAANIQLRRGRINDTALEIMDSLRLAEKPSLTQRVLKFFLRLKGF